jgi:type I restriction enzyme M protein
MEKKLLNLTDKIKLNLPTNKVSDLLYILITYKIMADFKKEKEYLREPHIITNYIQNIDIDELKKKASFSELIHQLEPLKIDNLINELYVENEEDFFKEIINYLNELDFSKEIARGNYKAVTEKFYDIQNWIFNKYSNFGEMASTPNIINILLKNILNLKENETLLDPCIGTGKLALEVGENAKQIIGQEINDLTYEITKINMLIANEDISKIFRGDSLFENNFEKADVVVSNSPFGLRSNRYDNMFLEYLNWGEPSKSGLDLYFLSLILYYMKDRGAIIFPEGILFKSRKDGEVRKNIVDENLIEAVISLPNGIFDYTGIATSILILNKNKKDNKILMIDTKEMFEKIRGGVNISDEKIKEIIDIFHSKKEVKNISKLITLDILAKNDYILTVNRYIIPEMEEENIDLNELSKEVNEIGYEIENLKKEINKLIKKI